MTCASQATWRRNRPHYTLSAAAIRKANRPLPVASRVVCTPGSLRSGRSCNAVDGRLQVDVSVENSLYSSAGNRWVLVYLNANQRISRRKPRCSFDYAFSPTCNSADLNVTPHE